MMAAANRECALDIVHDKVFVSTSFNARLSRTRSDPTIGSVTSG
jgi:hypothetical protein